MLSNDMSNNADEFGGQTVPEKIAEHLHGQDTVIVKLTPTSVAPERQRLNVYTSEVFQAILVRLPGRVYEAVMQDESRHQLIAVNFGRGAFFCQVKRSIATHLLPPLVTHEKKMRIEAADNTIITLVSETVDVTEAKPKGFIGIPGYDNTVAMGMPLGAVAMGMPFESAVSRRAP